MDHEGVLLPVIQLPLGICRKFIDNALFWAWSRIPKRQGRAIR
jgi:hypothetical protein